MCMNDLMVLLGSSSRSQSLSSCPLHEQPYGEAVSQRKGEALPEGKVRRLLLKTHCPVTSPQTSIHSLRHAHTYRCTGTSRMLSQHFLSQLASSVLRALGCRQDTVSGLFRNVPCTLSSASGFYQPLCLILLSNIDSDSFHCDLFWSFISFSLLHFKVHSKLFFALFSVIFTFWFLFREYPTM